MLTLQRIANCILKDENKVLLLQKPSKGWWVAPGGKIESEESVKEAVKRKYREETGIYIINPDIKGIFTVIIKNNEKVVDEWMMFTFFSEQFEGTMLDESPEGKLQWQKTEDIQHLPMARGDHFIFNHILNNEEVIYGTFYYTEKFELLSYRLDPSPKEGN